MRKEFGDKLPLPLGEGWGEGLATKPKTLLSPFLIGANRKEDGGEFSFLFTQLHPHPSPLPVQTGDMGNRCP